MTPNGQAAMQSRQPLHASDWITTVSNSVRMIAPVGHTSMQPAFTQCLQTSLIMSQRPCRRELLDELHVPPVGAVEPAGVVVAVAGQRVLAAVGRGELVPLLARDLARLAPDADRGVGEEPHRLRHHAFSTLHTKALPSWIETLGSPTSAVSSFAASPVTRPS